MEFIIGLIIFSFLLMPLGAVINARKTKVRRRQNVEDMKEALKSGAEASGGCGYSGKRQITAEKKVLYAALLDQDGNEIAGVARIPIAGSKALREAFMGPE
jgi:hypothetical protein